MPASTLQRLGIGVLAGATALTMAACGSSGGNSKPSTGGSTGKTSSSKGAPAAAGGDWAKAQSATAGGGMAALVAAANKEGALNVIALPPTWANYASIIANFEKQYPKIKIHSENPNGASGDEINAIKSTKGQPSAPDVVDVGNSYALSGAQEGLYAPYKVATWNDIPAGQKDPGGLWFSDYGGYISIGCNKTKVGTCPTTIKQLDNPKYKGKVALNGSPLTANAAFEAVWAAALANGGSATNIQPGIDFFHKLNSEGIFNKTQVKPATVASGATPIVLDWDYLNAAETTALAKEGQKWQVTDPADGLVSGYYAQAISINAAHPAAARLWEEYLYSQKIDDGQNGWLRGFARPIELVAMQANGSADKTAVAKIPPVKDTTPFNPTQAQVTAAKNVVTQKWSAAVS